MMLINSCIFAFRVQVWGLLGPRQCGKTTFAKMKFSGFEYFDLERPAHLEQISGDIELFLKSRKGPVIIDEAQRLPNLFSALRAHIDINRKKNGQIVLLGSASFKLVKGISESLAGRVGFIDLSGLHVREIIELVKDTSRHWLKGGFPDAFLPVSEKKLDFDWFENYTRSLIERDWPALGIHFNASQFRQLWAMLAVAHGTVLNKNKLASSMGVSPHTVERYIEILEESFLLRRLQPYHVNLKKRLIRSPKLYLRDSGLLHYFLRITEEKDLFISPQRGPSFEGYVVEQICHWIGIISPQSKIFYFRTSDGIEVDLLVEHKSRIFLFEVKTKTSINQKDVISLEKAHKLLSAEQSVCIYLGENSYPLTEKIKVLSFEKWAREGMSLFWNRLLS